MSATQRITPELKRWIVEQATTGQSPAAVLKAMRDSGWSADVAEQALEDTLRSHLIDRAEALTLPPQLRVPEPLHSDGSLSIALTEDSTAASRNVQVLTRLTNPRIVVFGGLLSADECDELVALAGARLARSETVESSTGGSEINSARTSEGMFFGREENALCARIENRIAELLRWPLDHGEGLQVLRYRPGAEYKPHYDYFDLKESGTPALLARGGQRVASLVIYLNTPVRGGATVFPDVELSVTPVKGNAVFFSYDRPHPMTRSLHGGAPVIEGEKWVATKWLRERRFE